MCSLVVFQEGNAMPPVNLSDPNLLYAIIGTVGALWAIGVAIYTFVYNYLQSWAGPTRRRDAEDPLLHPDADGRLREYKKVFWGYMVMGLLSSYTILFSFYAVVYDVAKAEVLARWLFSTVLVGYGVLFSLEILTSIWYVRDRRNDAAKLQEKPLPLPHPKDRKGRTLWHRVEMVVLAVLAILIFAVLLLTTL